jgi:hypothetical protein
VDLHPARGSSLVLSPCVMSSFYPCGPWRRDRNGDKTERERARDQQDHADPKTSRLHFFIQKLTCSRRWNFNLRPASASSRFTPFAGGGGGCSRDPTAPAVQYTKTINQSQRQTRALYYSIYFPGTKISRRLRTAQCNIHNCMHFVHSRERIRESAPEREG